MPKRGRHHRGQKKAPKRSRPLHQPQPPSVPPEQAYEEAGLGPEHTALLKMVRPLLKRHPSELLEFVSTMWNLSDRRNDGPLDRSPEQEEMEARETLVESFLAVDVIETTALLAVLGAFLPASGVSEEIGPELQRRTYLLPPWLRGLSQAQVTGCMEMVDPLGDGDNLILEVRLSDGQRFTLVVYIDHNVGILVKDAYVVASRLSGFLAAAEEVGTDPDTVIRDLDLADAKVRITEAIASAATVVEPFESETWPALRPLVEWVAGLLPDGGHGYEIHEWTKAELAEISERFMSQSFEEEDRVLVEVLFELAANYPPYDPLHWSPVSVEIMLMDLVPRKLLFPTDELVRVPDVMRVIVGLVHAEREIRQELTEDTWSSIDLFEPPYLKLIDPSAFEFDDRLAPFEPDFDDDDDILMFDGRPPTPDELRAILLERLADRVGGREVLDALSAESIRPLPDEALTFNLFTLPERERHVAASVLALCDAASESLFDIELRTACRRLLAMTLEADPELIARGNAKPERTATALVWAVASGNELFSEYGGVMVKDLVAHMGVKNNPTDRAWAILRGVGLGNKGWGPPALGTTRLLVSSYLQDLVRFRDEIRSPDWLKY